MFREGVLASSRFIPQACFQTFSTSLCAPGGCNSWAASASGFPLGGTGRQFKGGPEEKEGVFTSHPHSLPAWPHFDFSTESPGSCLAALSCNYRSCWVRKSPLSAPTPGAVPMLLLSCASPSLTASLRPAFGWEKSPFVTFSLTVPLFIFLTPLSGRPFPAGTHLRQE